MGSFNTTCFVSQQTISTDNSVVIFPIKQQTSFNPFDMTAKYQNTHVDYSKFGYSNNNCYTNSFWDFSGPMLKGKYNDFGSFQWEKTKENAFNIYCFLHYLYTDVCDIKESKGYHNAFTFSEFFDPTKQYQFDELVLILDKVWDMHNRNGLFVSKYSSGPVNLTFSVMHHSCFDYLLKNTNRGNFEEKTFFNNYLNNELNLTKKMSDTFSEKELIAFFSSSISMLNNFNIGISGSPNISQYYSRSQKTIEIIKNYLLEGNTSISKAFSDELFTNFKDNIEHRYIVEALNTFGIRLSPIVYTPQDYSNQIGNQFLEMVKAVNKEVNLVVSKKHGEDFPSKNLKM